MNHFPVSNSNLSAAHLGVFLQDRYPLSAGAECRLIRAGVNHTYLVRGGEDNLNISKEGGSDPL